MDDPDAVGTVPIKSLAGALAAQLLKLADIEGEQERIVYKRKFSVLDQSSSEDSSTSTITLPWDENQDIRKEDEDEDVGVTYIMMSGKRIEGCTPVEEFVDGNGKVHTLSKFPIVQTGMKKKNDH